MTRLAIAAVAALISLAMPNNAVMSVLIPTGPTVVMTGGAK